MADYCCNSRYEMISEADRCDPCGRGISVFLRFFDGADTAGGRDNQVEMMNFVLEMMKFVY